MKSSRVIVLVVAIIIIALIAIIATRKHESAVTVNPEPTSFEDCSTKYPIINGNPRTCVSPSGAVFTEVVTTTSTTTTTVTQPSTPATPPSTSAVKVTSPSANQKVTSPLTVSGQARGNWYSEAVFPIELRNAAGAVIATGQAHAQGDWMTTNYVPFTATLAFPAQAAGSHGTLVLKKDNPSGLPQNDASVSVPVTF